MGNLIRGFLVTPLVALGLALGVLVFNGAPSALAWDLSASCSGQNNVVGTLDVPSDAGGGLPYNVFVEWQDGSGGWHWVTDAGQNINGTGSQNFNMDVSKTPSEAQWLRVRYKDKNGTYGPETSALFRPCRPAPTPVPLHVFDLQGECIRANIVGGMIGIPNGAVGLPYTVFVEYQTSDGEWHWVRDAGKEINRVGLVNFEMDVSATPANIKWLRIRYKDRDWVYGSEISSKFAPCYAPTATPTRTNTPTRTPTNTPVPPSFTPVPRTNTPVVVAPTNTPVPSCKCITPPNTGSGGYLQDEEGDGRSKWYFIRWAIAAGIIGSAAAAMMGYTLVCLPRRDD